MCRGNTTGTLKHAREALKDSYNYNGFRRPRASTPVKYAHCTSKTRALTKGKDALRGWLRAREMLRDCPRKTQGHGPKTFPEPTQWSFQDHEDSVKIPVGISCKSTSPTY